MTIHPSEEEAPATLSDEEAAKLEALRLAFSVLAFDAGPHGRFVGDMPTVAALVACARAVTAELGWD